MTAESTKATAEQESPAATVALKTMPVWCLWLSDQQSDQPTATTVEPKPMTEPMTEPTPIAIPIATPTAIPTMTVPTTR